MSRLSSSRCGASDIVRGTVTGPIFLKLIAAIACLTAVALLSADLLASRVAERYFVSHLEREFEEKGRC